jgi:hypothetical protein
MMKKKLLLIVATLCVFITSANAADYEEKTLGLPVGLHQGAPYNSMLPTVTFVDTSSRGTPLVGCVPLSLARVMFYKWEVDPITNPQFYTVLKAMHQNSADVLIFESDSTGVTPSDVNDGIINKRNGFERQDNYQMPTISTVSSQRQRISDLYIWVRDKIKQGKPVIAVSYSGGHAFVIDGYKTINPYFGSEDLYLHVLWGWDPESAGDAQWVQIDKDAGLGSWLEFANARVKKYFSDFSLSKANFFTLKERTDYKWTGNGSIISHSTGSIKDWGITYDEAKIHPGSYTSVFFLLEVNIVD